MATANQKREALAALDDMEAMIHRVAPRPGEVRLERDTVLDLLARFRGWVDAFPITVHRPYQPPHKRTQVQP
jgi:hypothetical protein